MAAAKKKYVTDPKTGKPLSVNPKKVQEAGVGSVGKTAIKLGVKVAQKAIKSATTSSKIKASNAAVKAKEAAKTAKIAKNSVKTVEVDKNTPRYVIQNRNKVATETAAKRKSGEMAKLTGSRVNTNPVAGVTGKERVVIKINSAKAKANAIEKNTKNIK